MKNYLAVVVNREGLGDVSGSMVEPNGTNEGVEIYMIEADDADSARSQVYKMIGVEEPPSEEDFEDEDEYDEALYEWSDEYEDLCVEIFEKTNNGISF